MTNMRPEPHLENLKDKGGRPKGAPNKVTTTVKEALMKDFSTIEGGPEAYFKDLRERFPNVYAQLIAKLLPAATEISGANGESLQITVKYVNSDSEKFKL